MNALFGILAAPSAAHAVDLVHHTAKAVASPFDALLKTALGVEEPLRGAPAGIAAHGDDASATPAIAAKFQELLTSLGMRAGESITLEVDEWTGDLTAEPNSPYAEQLEQALAGQPALAASIFDLGRAEGRLDGSPFKSKSHLRIEVVQDGAAAELDWL